MSARVQVTSGVAVDDHITLGGRAKGLQDDLRLPDPVAKPSGAVSQSGGKSLAKIGVEILLGRGKHLVESRDRTRLRGDAMQRSLEPRVGEGDKKCFAHHGWPQRRRCPSDFDVSYVRRRFLGRRVETDASRVYQERPSMLME